MLRLALLVTLSAAAAPASAQCRTASTGDYRCDYGCRPTDANPRVEIDGVVARCWNELGGLYIGAVRPPNRLLCFRKVGVLSCDGNTIVWSDGVVWKRR